MAGWVLLLASAALALAYGLAGPALREAGLWVDLVGALKASGIVVLAALAAIERAPRLVVWALIFGAAGDASLARGTNEAFMAGALAFAFGHVCYTRAFLASGIGVAAALKQSARVIAMLALIVAAMVGTALLVPRDNAMFVPLSVYTGVLTLMAMSSFTLSWTRWLAMLGALLFFISDGFVAANLFHAPANATAAFWLNFAGWMIYWAAQAGLCLGALGMRTPQQA